MRDEGKGRARDKNDSPVWRQSLEHRSQHPRRRMVGKDTLTGPRREKDDRERPPHFLQALA